MAKSKTGAGPDTAHTMQDRWLDCVARLESELPTQQFKPWIKPLVYLGFEPDTLRLRLGVPGQFKLNLIRNQFESRIGAVASEVYGQPIQLSFELVSANASPPAPSSTASFDAATEPDPLSSQRPAHDNAAAGARRAEPDVNASRLRADLSFDNFVHGKANQMAWSAALQVVEHPGTQYNPLFLYGGVGLGKTHLLHAAGNALRLRAPGMRVRYIHAQDYFDEMVRGIQRKSLVEFKAKYQSLDLLLVDDIQFLGGKDRTQEEFFYTFEALLSARKQLILTCDSYPKELSGIEERLVSRFGSGLIVEIEPPELEMRVAILLKKAEMSGERLPEDVAFFIARHLRSNVRELEGALLRVIAFARFRNKAISAELAREALKDILALNRAPVSIESIQKTVSDFFKIKVADMYSKRRPAHIARARQVAMYFSKELTQKSFPEIGEAFGGRDHTTVMHAVKRITEMRQHDQEMNRQLHVLEQTLRG
jgi:chromosomal replication initiator protein